MSVRVEDDYTTELHRMPGEDPVFAGRREKKRRCWCCCACTLFITGIVTVCIAVGVGLSYNAIGGDVQLYIDQVVYTGI